MVIYLSLKEKESEKRSQGLSPPDPPRPEDWIQFSFREHHTHPTIIGHPSSPSLAPSPHNPPVSRQRHIRKVERGAWEAQGGGDVTQSTSVSTCGGLPGKGGGGGGAEKVTDQGKRAELGKHGSSQESA